VREERGARGEGRGARMTNDEARMNDESQMVPRSLGDNFSSFVIRA
jgi:hypothetical protein